MEKIIVRISGKTYYKMRKAGKLSSLAIYVCLVKNNSSKTYWFKPGTKTILVQNVAKQIGVSVSALYKALKDLEAVGLLSAYDNEIRLTKNADLFRERGKRVFVPNYIVGYKDILMMLKSIPVLSNLCSQKKAVDKAEHFKSIEHNPKASLRELKSLERWLKKRGATTLEYNSDLMASNNVLKKALEVSSNSPVQKIKKFLSDNLLVQFSSRKEIVLKRKLTRKEYHCLVSLGEIDDACFYHKGRVFRQTPTVAFLLWRYNR